MRTLFFSLTSALLVRVILGAVAEFESIQLSETDITEFSAVDYGDENAHIPRRSVCRAFPGSDDWPTDHEWSRLNKTLGGVLLKPLPPAVVCYEGPAYDANKCKDLVQNAGKTHFYLEDPVTVLTQWTQGSTCMPSLNATGTCEQGGFPVYVVNATRVSHVQAAVNFARNKNLRLIIKNTGHDFGGRSVGAGSLSIWTRHLRNFEYLPEYTQGEYTGMAAHFGSGLEAWEIYNYMFQYNITVVAAGGRTVGANGGWFASGGHGNLASLYGLGADQALEIHAVTADGRFVIANPYKNVDLFYALRGGGGSTYAVVTSVIVKAYPPINLTRTSLSFACNNGKGSLDDPEVFWKGFSIYSRFSAKAVDAGGVDWSYLYPLGNGTFTFTVSTTFPGKTSEEVIPILQPLFDDLNAAGINVTAPKSIAPQAYAAETKAPAEALANTRYRSRLFPRKNWDDDKLYEKSIGAIRASIEAGYTFHGLSMGPSKDVAGWPGRDSGVNPAWRNAILHANLMSTQPVGLTAQAALDEEAQIQRSLALWREVTPGSGAYMNEGDPGEPNWQQSFYGSLYPRLLKIKRKRDPWGVFWAPTTVGSEQWEVITEDGYPRSQNGRLCRVNRD